MGFSTVARSRQLDRVVQGCWEAGKLGKPISLKLNRQIPSHRIRGFGSGFQIGALLTRASTSAYVSYVPSFEPAAFYISVLSYQLSWRRCRYEASWASR